MNRKYPAPKFLDGIHDQRSYERWLSRKAAAHVRRDRKRGNSAARLESYKQAIHEAVAASGGKDFYTGEALDWSLLSTYNNSDSKKLRRQYKKRFSFLPSVDHVNDGLGPADFRICGWRTNDCKNDLSHAELVAFCEKVIEHAG